MYLVDAVWHLPQGPRESGEHLVKEAIDQGDVDEEVVHAARLLADYSGKYRRLLEAVYQGE